MVKITNTDGQIVLQIVLPKTRYQWKQERAKLRERSKNLKHWLRGLIPDKIDLSPFMHTPPPIV